MSSLGKARKAAGAETGAHTPGPWYALKGCRHIRTSMEIYDKEDVFGVRGGLCVAELPAIYEGGGHNEADARLIAAAPKMLEALRQCEEKFCGDYEGLLYIRSVIADATGS